MVEVIPTEQLICHYLKQLREMYGNETYLDVAEYSGVKSLTTFLAEFEVGICDCQKCVLGQTRTKFVFGVGDPSADLVFIGEAPGRDEDLQGEPFVGKAGQLLDRILAAIHLTRSQVYICNILKCRPPNNRTPTGEEIGACLSYLEQQLEIIHPRLIVALGAVAAQTLLSVKTPLFHLRSKVWRWRNYDLVVTYHPAALLRNPGLKRAAWEDFQWIQNLVQGD